MSPFKWLERWWYRRNMPKKPKIVIELSQDEFDLFRWWAGQNGKSVTEWAKESLNQVVPDRARKRLKGSPAQEAVLDAAFAALEDQEEGAVLPFGGNPPVPKPVAPAPVVAKPSLPIIPDGHPCKHLLRVFDGRYGPADCQGTCQNPKQMGKPCFWTGTAARGCPVYEPKFAQRPQQRR